MKKIFIFIFLFFGCFLANDILSSERVEINTASLEQLDTLAGIGPAYAQRIIEGRPYSSVDDLIRVSGIGEKTLQKIKDQGLAYVATQSSLPLATKETAQPEIETATEPITALNEPIKKALTEPAWVRPPLDYPAGIVFNEILPSPEGADETEEWIEIFNQNNFEVDLQGWKIQDINGTVKTYVFPENTKIAGYGYLVLKRPETKITLNNTEDGLNLLNPNQKIIDSLVYNTAPRNQSYNKTGNNWAWSDILTPGSLNNISENKQSDNKLSAVSENLPNPKKFDISKEVNENFGTAGISKSETNPWFLFLTALIITIVSAVIILILKIRFRTRNSE